MNERDLIAELQQMAHVVATPEMFRDVVRTANLSNSKVAELTGVHARNVRAWMGGAGVPYSVFFTLRAKICLEQLTNNQNESSHVQD